MTRFEEYVAGRRAEHGERFSAAGLDNRFIRYFNSGERIKVRSKWGEEYTGTVGASTGWVPVFLLMRRSGAAGSSYILGDSYTIVAVQRGRKYEAVR